MTAEEMMTRCSRKKNAWNREGGGGGRGGREQKDVEFGTRRRPTGLESSFWSKSILGCQGQAKVDTRNKTEGKQAGDLSSRSVWLVGGVKESEEAPERGEDKGQSAISLSQNDR